MERNEKNVKERIAKDLAEHVVTERHRHGLYRHWRCQRPGTWNMGFDIVTWPGSLCYTGDMGDYLFQRTADMVAFMRGSCMSYSYAAEKCVAHDGRLKEWSEESFRLLMAETAKEREEFKVVRHGGARMEKVSDTVAGIISEYETYSSRHDAERAMYESGLFDDMPSCEEYTVHFLWCLHAIHWFVEKLDSEQVVKTQGQLLAKEGA